MAGTLAIRRPTALIEVNGWSEAIRLLHCAKMRQTPPVGNFLLWRGPKTKLTAGH